MTREIHLGMIVLGTGSHVAGWRLPEAEFGSQNFPLIRRVVQAAERGKLDLVFFADAVNTGLDAHPGMMLRFEPLTLLAALSQSTSRIGLVATVSTTYSEPYNVARAFASLDHLSGGRVGWNVVTGSSPDAAANFSRDRHPPHAERYAIAEEYVTVAKGLWDSWEEDAILGEKATGRYVDPARMHVLGHRGEHFSVEGPLNITRPPQGYPVIFQAGASDRGLEFAARTAEVIFATQQIMEEAAAFAEKLRDLTEAAGRTRDAIRILFGISPVIGATEAEARDKIAGLAALIDPAAALRVLSDRLGHDLSGFDLDAPLPDLPPSGMMQGHAVVLTSLARRRNLTLRELRDYAAASSGHRLVYGTAAQVADDLQMWFESGVADGFVVMSSYLPGPAEQFIDEVVPILRERGLFRQDYTGATLREHLGLPRPAHPARAPDMASRAAG